MDRYGSEPTDMPCHQELIEELNPLCEGGASITNAPTSEALPTSRRLGPAAQSGRIATSVGACWLETAATAQLYGEYDACSVDRFNSFFGLSALAESSESCLPNGYGSLAADGGQRYARLLRPRNFGYFRSPATQKSNLSERVALPSLCGPSIGPTSGCVKRRTKGLPHGVSGIQPSATPEDRTYANDSVHCQAAELRPRSSDELGIGSFQSEKRITCLRIDGTESSSFHLLPRDERKELYVCRLRMWAYSVSASDTPHNALSWRTSYFISVMRKLWTVHGTEGIRCTLRRTQPIAQYLAAEGEGRGRAFRCFTEDGTVQT